jgi:DNA-binding NtrC family response regulator
VESPKETVHSYVPVPRPRYRASFLHQQRDVIEKEIIQRALMENGYRRALTAEVLGISRVALHKKLKKFGLTAPKMEPVVD